MSILDKEIRGAPLRYYLWPPKNEYRASDRSIFISIAAAIAVAIAVTVTAIVDTATQHTAPRPTTAVTTHPTKPITIPATTNAPVSAQAKAVLLAGAMAQWTGQWNHVPVVPGSNESIGTVVSHQVSNEHIIRVISSTPSLVVAQIGGTTGTSSLSIYSTVELHAGQWEYVPE